MKPLIAIYRSHDIPWRDAYRWAIQKDIDCRVYKQDCYRGMNYRATMYYTGSDSIAADYTVAGISRLTDEDIDDDES